MFISVRLRDVVVNASIRVRLALADTPLGFMECLLHQATFSLLVHVLLDYVKHKVFNGDTFVLRCDLDALVTDSWDVKDNAFLRDHQYKAGLVNFVTS